MEHLPSVEGNISTRKHITKKYFLPFLKIFLVVIFIAFASYLAFSSIKNLIFPEIKIMQEKLALFSDVIDDINTLKKQKTTWQTDISRIQEELNNLKQKLENVEKIIQNDKNGIQPPPLIKTIENSTNHPYINFIHSLKEGHDFDDAFKNIAHIRLGNKYQALVEQLQKFYKPNITLMTLQKDFNTLYIQLKKEDKSTESHNIFKQIKNYLTKNIHISFKDKNLVLLPGATLEKAKDKMEKKDVNGALNDMLPLKPFKETVDWINKASLYLRIEKMIEKLSKIEQEFES